MTKNLALKLAPVRVVNLIAAGFVDTPGARAKRVIRGRTRLERKQPFARFGPARDVRGRHAGATNAASRSNRGAAMYETHNDLSPSIRERMIALLNARLADAIDLRTQLKVAHWNVKGPQFIALHKLFDEIVEDADEYVDLIAERAVQLGGIADGTARQVAERTSLDEYAATGGGGGS